MARKKKGLPLLREELAEVPSAPRYPFMPAEAATDTGIFSTRLPRDAGHLVRDLLDRRVHLPFLRQAIRFDELADAEIGRHGFPSKPASSDRFRAPASVHEAYQLREAFREWDRILTMFLSPRVARAVAQAGGGLFPKATTEMRVAIGQKLLMQLLEATVEIGVLGQRLEVRTHEPNALRGRKVLSSARKGHATVHGTNAEIARRLAQHTAAYDQLRSRRPQLTRTGAAKLVAKKFKVALRTILLHTQK